MCKYRPRVTEEVEARCNRVGRGSDRDFIDGRRTQREFEIAERCAVSGAARCDRWIRQGQRTVEHVDKVVPFIHSRRRHQGELRIEGVDVRNARRRANSSILSRTWTSLSIKARAECRGDLWGYTRTIAELAHNPRVGYSEVVSARVIARISQDRIQGAERQSGAMVIRIDA